jgi:hypothetical protein
MGINMIVYANTDYYKLQSLASNAGITVNGVNLRTELQTRTMGKTHEIPENTEGSADYIQPPSIEEIPPEIRESI